MIGIIFKIIYDLFFERVHLKHNKSCVLLHTVTWCVQYKKMNDLCGCFIHLERHTQHSQNECNENENSALIQSDYH